MWDYTQFLKIKSMNILKSTETKLTSVLSGLTVISVGLLSNASPAQAAQLGAGRLDITSLPNGFVRYTQNALDFTSEVDANGLPIPSPDPNPNTVSSTQPPDGFGVAAGSGSLVGATDPFIGDLFSPVAIPERPNAPLTFDTPVELVKFTLPVSGEALFSFTSVVREPGTETVDLVFEGFFTDVSGNDFDLTPATFAVLTGQTPIEALDTPIVASVADIPTLGTPETGDSNFTSWSATFLVEDQDIPEPSTALGAFLVLGSFSLLKRKIQKNPAS